MTPSRRVALLLALILWPGVSVAIGTAASDEVPPPGIEPGLYTLPEARELGLDVPDSPQAYGLPACDIDLSYKGEAYDSSEVADPSAEPTCAVDPEQGHIAVGWPAPHYGPPPPTLQGYHHLDIRLVPLPSQAEKWKWR
jgi:hypothetical protein